MNHKGTKAQKGHKEKSVKIYQIGEHIFLNINGEWSLVKRTKSERGKKELGIGLVVRGRVLNHKDAMTQKGHKEKSVKICLIREHIFLNTNAEWNLAKRTKRERGKKEICNWVSGEGKVFEPQRRYDAKGTQRKICENLFIP